MSRGHRDDRHVGDGERAAGERAARGLRRGVGDGRGTGEHDQRGARGAAGSNPHRGSGSVVLALRPRRTPVSRGRRDTLHPADVSHRPICSRVRFPPQIGVATRAPRQRPPCSSSAARPGRARGLDDQARLHHAAAASRRPSSRPEPAPRRPPPAGDRPAPRAPARARRSRRRSCRHAGVETGFPARHESASAGAPAAHTPITCVAGIRALAQVPIPAISAPSPIGTSSASNGSGQRPSSTAIVPAPSEISGSRPSSTNRAPVAAACARASLLRGLEVVALEPHLGPERAHALDLERIGRPRREHRHPEAAPAAGPGEPLPEVARRRADQLRPGWKREPLAEPVGCPAP